LVANLSIQIYLGVKQHTILMMGAGNNANNLRGKDPNGHNTLMFNFPLS